MAYISQQLLVFTTSALMCSTPTQAASRWLNSRPYRPKDSGPPGCMYGSELLMVGERRYPPGCVRRVCKSDRGTPRLQEQFCDPLLPVPPSCHVDRHSNRRFPDCCPTIKCPHNKVPANQVAQRRIVVGNRRPLRPSSGVQRPPHRQQPGVHRPSFQSESSKIFPAQLNKEVQRTETLLAMGFAMEMPEFREWIMGKNSNEGFQWGPANDMISSQLSFHSPPIYPNSLNQVLKDQQYNEKDHSTDAVYIEMPYQPSLDHNMDTNYFDNTYQPSSDNNKDTDYVDITYQPSLAHNSTDTVNIEKPYQPSLDHDINTNYFDNTYQPSSDNNKDTVHVDKTYQPNLVPNTTDTVYIEKPYQPNLDHDMDTNYFDNTYQSSPYSNKDTVSVDKTYQPSLVQNRNKVYIDKTSQPNSDHIIDAVFIEKIYQPSSTPSYISDIDNDNIVQHKTQTTAPPMNFSFTEKIYEPSATPSYIADIDNDNIKQHKTHPTPPPTYSVRTTTMYSSTNANLGEKPTSPIPNYKMSLKENYSNPSLSENVPIVKSSPPTTIYPLSLKPSTALPNLKLSKPEHHDILPTLHLPQTTSSDHTWYLPIKTSQDESIEQKIEAHETTTKPQHIQTTTSIQYANYTSYRDKSDLIHWPTYPPSYYYNRPPIPKLTITMPTTPKNTFLISKQSKEQPIKYLDDFNSSRPKPISIHRFSTKIPNTISTIPSTSTTEILSNTNTSLQNSTELPSSLKQTPLSTNLYTPRLTKSTNNSKTTAYTRSPVTSTFSKNFFGTTKKKYVRNSTKPPNITETDNAEENTTKTSLPKSQVQPATIKVRKKPYRFRTAYPKLKRRRTTLPPTTTEIMYTTWKGTIGNKDPEGLPSSTKSVFTAESEIRPTVKPNQENKITTTPDSYETATPILDPNKQDILDLIYSGVDPSTLIIGHEAEMKIKQYPTRIIPGLDLDSSPSILDPHLLSLLSRRGKYVSNLEEIKQVKRRIKRSASISNSIMKRGKPIFYLPHKKSLEFNYTYIANNSISSDESTHESYSFSSKPDMTDKVNMYTTTEPEWRAHLTMLPKVYLDKSVFLNNNNNKAYNSVGHDRNITGSISVYTHNITTSKEKLKNNIITEIPKTITIPNFVTEINSVQNSVNFSMGSFSQNPNLLAVLGTKVNKNNNFNAIDDDTVSTTELILYPLTTTITPGDKEVIKDMIINSSENVDIELVLPQYNHSISNKRNPLDKTSDEGGDNIETHFIGINVQGRENVELDTTQDIHQTTELKSIQFSSENEDFLDDVSAHYRDFERINGKTVQPFTNVPLPSYGAWAEKHSLGVMAYEPMRKYVNNRTVPTTIQTRYRPNKNTRGTPKTPIWNRKLENIGHQTTSRNKHFKVVDYLDHEIDELTIQNPLQIIEDTEGEFLIPDNHETGNYSENDKPMSENKLFLSNIKSNNSNETIEETYLNDILIYYNETIPVIPAKTPMPTKITNNKIQNMELGNEHSQYSADSNDSASFSENLNNQNIHHVMQNNGKEILTEGSKGMKNNGRQTTFISKNNPRDKFGHKAFANNEKERQLNQQEMNNQSNSQEIHQTYKQELLPQKEVTNRERSRTTLWGGRRIFTLPSLNSGKYVSSYAPSYTNAQMFNRSRRRGPTKQRARPTNESLIGFKANNNEELNLPQFSNNTVVQDKDSNNSFSTNIFSQRPNLRTRISGYQGQRDKENIDSAVKNHSKLPNSVLIESEEIEQGVDNDSKFRPLSSKYNRENMFQVPVRRQNRPYGPGPSLDINVDNLSLSNFGSQSLSNNHKDNSDNLDLYKPQVLTLRPWNLGQNSTNTKDNSDYIGPYRPQVTTYRPQVTNFRPWRLGQDSTRTWLASRPPSRRRLKTRRQKGDTDNT